VLCQHVSPKMLVSAGLAKGFAHPGPTAWPA